MKSFLFFVFSEKCIFSLSNIVLVMLMESASAGLIWLITGNSSFRPKRRKQVRCSRWFVPCARTFLNQINHRGVGATPSLRAILQCSLKKEFLRCEWFQPSFALWSSEGRERNINRQSQCSWQQRFGSPPGVRVAYLPLHSKQWA